jgi:CBS domain containing-hemolysin-like protein
MAAPPGESLTGPVRQTQRMDTFVTGVGFGLMVVGFAIFLIGAATRMNYVRNSLSPDSLPLWFRAEGLVLLGGSIVLLGLIVAARWWSSYLIIVAVFVAGAVVLIRSRMNWR